MMKDIDVKRLIERRLEHARKRVNQYKQAHGENPGQTHTYHGGWDLGYWEGKLSTYEDMLDEINE